MKESIILLFNQKTKENNYYFEPSIKVIRRNDTLYITEIRKNHFANSRVNYSVIVERGTEQAVVMPLAMMDELSLTAIWLRLKGTGEKLLEIENKKRA